MMTISAILQSDAKVFRRPKDSNPRWEELHQQNRCFGNFNGVLCLVSGNNGEYSGPIVAEGYGWVTKDFCILESDIVANDWEKVA